MPFSSRTALSARRASTTSTSSVSVSVSVSVSTVTGSTSTASRAVTASAATASEDDEWLARRREQVARASRKTRHRRRDELQSLRDENERLRVERTALLSKIEDLVREVDHVSGDPIQALENELLKSQIDQHQLFLKGMLESLETSAPKGPSQVNHDIAKQTVDFASNEALRLLAQSQTGAGDWSRPLRVASEFIPPGLTVVLRHQRRADGGLNIRCDGAVNRLAAAYVPPRFVRDEYVRTWCELSKFQEAFARGAGQLPFFTAGASDTRGRVEGSTFEFAKLPEFSFGIEGDPEEFKVDAHHWRESAENDAVKYDWVFLIGTKKADFAKSTLWTGRAVNDILVRGAAQSLMGTVFEAVTSRLYALAGGSSSAGTVIAQHALLASEVGGGGGGPTAASEVGGGPTAAAETAGGKGGGAADPRRSKRARTAHLMATQPTDKEPPVGTSTVFHAIRTLTCHGSPPASGADDAGSVRVTHNFFESVFFWQDTLETEVAQEDLFGRFTTIISAPPDFKFTPVGTIHDFIDAQGDVTPRFAEVVGKHIRTVLANAL